jgi:23S rRNA pseudouridine1911/1915/1917 synthase
VSAAGAAPGGLRVVHLDEWLAVIEKPAGLIVHPAPSHRGPTLVDELAEILGGGADPERPGIVHRLDKDTSGLLVVARDDGTHAALQEAVRRREVERIYLALAQGRLASRTGTIDAPIGRASKQRHRMAVSGAASRQARTHFEVLELLAAETYLEARLETGRTHQIRAHFAAIGHPLLGDATYGGEPRYGLDRQFLHAHRLAFAHPATGEPMSFRSELPADLGAALAAARGAHAS